MSGLLTDELAAARDDREHGEGGEVGPGRNREAVRLHVVHHEADPEPDPHRQDPRQQLLRVRGHVGRVRPREWALLRGRRAAGRQLPRDGESFLSSEALPASAVPSPIQSVFMTGAVG